ncbi:MAG: hypothetical protein DMG57_12330 [Acidobacteria bacterium]|nr:MAG: hypothetical protein DMG57_12330 [Acidobacteriota bacterium]
MNRRRRKFRVALALFERFVKLGTFGITLAPENVLEVMARSYEFADHSQLTSAQTRGIDRHLYRTSAGQALVQIGGDDGFPAAGLLLLSNQQ